MLAHSRIVISGSARRQGGESSEWRLSLNPQLPVVASGSTPIDLAVDGGDAFLYAINNGSNSLWQYAIGVNGQITRTSLPPLSVGAGPVSVILTPVR